MDNDYAIEVSHISKSFKVFLDKGSTLKERALFRNRNRYELRKVLNDVSFNVKRGEALGLIGHNGCGKSTTLKLLTRILYPDTGSITMRGRCSSLIELGAGFHPDMSGRENIYINASIFGLTKKEIDARIDDIIEFSELEEYIDNPVRTYSSGMYMRLAFSVAINVDADILLIDEILAVGDANFQSKCFNRLREIKNSGVTIVLVSHDMSAVQSFCGNAMWINDGNCMAYGPSVDVVDEYLSYMDGKRVERENAETDSNNHSSSPQALDISANHFGVGEITIEGVSILDDEGNSVRALYAGRNYTIEISYNNEKEIKDCVYGMGIYTMDKVCLMGSNTQIDRQQIETKSGRGKVTCRLLNLNLLTGRYILNVAIVDANGRPYDFYRDYMHFEVVSSDRSSGLVSVEHSWS